MSQIPVIELAGTVVRDVFEGDSIGFRIWLGLTSEFDGQLALITPV